MRDNRRRSRFPPAILAEQPLQIATQDQLLLLLGKLEHPDLENLETAIYLRFVAAEDHSFGAEFADSPLDITSQHHSSGIEVNIGVAPGHLDSCQVFPPVGRE